MEVREEGMEVQEEVTFRPMLSKVGPSSHLAESFGPKSNRVGMGQVILGQSRVKSTLGLSRAEWSILSRVGPC